MGSKREISFRGNLTQALSPSDTPARSALAERGRERENCSKSRRKPRMEDGSADVEIIAGRALLFPLSRGGGKGSGSGGSRLHGDGKNASVTTSCYPTSSVTTLRPVTEHDGEFLFAVYASTRVEELAQVGWTDAQKEDFLRQQFDAQRRCYEGDYPGAEFKVILADGQPAGRLYVHRREREIRIMDLALLPEFRGRGIGTGLLSEIFAEGDRTGRRVSIHVEVFNPALRLYERLGFRQVATHGVYLLLERAAQSPPAPAQF